MAALLVRWLGTTSTVYDLAGNWFPAAVPLITDHVLFPSDGTADCGTIADDGKDQSGVALTSFSVLEGFSGEIGSIDEPIAITAATVDLDCQAETYLDLNTVTTCNVTGAPSSGDGDYGMHLSAGAAGAAVVTINIDLEAGESVALAALPLATGTFTTINIKGDGEVLIGSGVTCTTVNVSGNGTVELACAATTLNLNGGEDDSPTVRHTAGAVTTVNVNRGRYHNNTTATVGTTNLYDGGAVDLTEGQAARAMTTISRFGLGIFLDPNKLATWTTFNIYGKLDNENLDIGEYFKITRAAI